MTADDSTPGRGKERTVEQRWEDVGRELLEGELRVRADEVNEKLYTAAGTISSGEQLTRRQVHEMMNALELAYRTVQLAGEAAGIEEIPDWDEPIQLPEDS
jgi:hypothetical protein